MVCIYWNQIIYFILYEEEHSNGDGDVDSDDDDEYHVLLNKPESNKTNHNNNNTNQLKFLRYVVTTIHKKLLNIIKKIRIKQQQTENTNTLKSGKCAKCYKKKLICTLMK